MLKRTLIVTAVCAGVVSACVPSRRPVAVVPEATPAKQIVRSGSDYVLPDGTRVMPDATGGFSLPNGDYVRRVSTGLQLPTGAVCTPTGQGFACP